MGHHVEARLFELAYMSVRVHDSLDQQAQLLGLLACVGRVSWPLGAARRPVARS
jgi:hypothetical protein